MVEPGENIEELPAYIDGDGPIRWPTDTLPEKAPGEPIQYITPADLYYPAKLRDDVIVYVRDGRDPNGLPRRVRDEILRRAGYVV